MKNKMYIGGTVLLLAATSAWATEETNNIQSPHADRGDQGDRGDSGDLYRSCELSFDGFGSASLGRYTIDHPSDSRVKHNTRLGAGAGANIFFTRYFGIGVDAYSENTSGTFIDNASANLILRLPIGQSCLAPYIFGGGGYSFDTVRASFGDAGVGLECRFTPNVGVFVDVRGVVPDRTKYYGVGRLGLRLSF